jgi:hypothetical protein
MSDINWENYNSRHAEMKAACKQMLKEYDELLGDDDPVYQMAARQIHQTKTGSMRIGEMSDQHLLNTIRRLSFSYKRELYLVVARKRGLVGEGELP